MLRLKLRLMTIIIILRLIKHGNYILQYIHQIISLICIINFRNLYCWLIELTIIEHTLNYDLWIIVVRMNRWCLCYPWTAGACVVHELLVPVLSVWTAGTCNVRVNRRCLCCPREQLVSVMSVWTAGACVARVNSWCLCCPCELLVPVSCCELLPLLLSTDPDHRQESSRLPRPRQLQPPATLLAGEVASRRPPHRWVAAGRPP